MSNIGGLGSALDINSIVSSMMDVEKLPLGRLDRTKSIYDLQLSTYDKFNTLLTNYSKSLDGLNSAFKNNAYKVSSSNDAVLSAILTGSNVAPGNHTVNITQLATASQIASMPFSSNNSPLTISGSLELQAGTTNISLSISPSDTLETVRDAINNALNNNGINASILATTSDLGAPEYRLVLSSTETGVANQLIISGDAFADLNLTNVLGSAQDAQFTFDGFNATSPNNTITNLIDGITFVLNAANSNATISISPDNANKNQNIMSAIHATIDAYNAIMAAVDKNESTKLVRDSTYSMVKLTLQNAMGPLLQNSMLVSSLDLGIQTAPSTKSINFDNEKPVEYVSTGALTINDKTLAAVLNSNFDEISTFFTDPSGGFIKAFQSVLTDLSASDGGIANRQNSIKKQESLIEDKISREEERLEFVEKSLIKQWSAVNIFKQKYENLSQFLEIQFASLYDNKK